uniref:RNase H domain-containing protein n=1 Tax=Haemonchus contortus TaxID=6289 RepID=A0A7I4XVL2_HAECO
MGMNLREFLSNEDALRDKLPKEAHAMKTTQKVRGITWDAKRDCINIRCTFDSLKNITKRVIARQIAMIYDPFELAMAKCKLPSIKTKTTMPKLEMNALTLAMRLANSITQALKERIAGYPWTIHVFSDSQIALSWLTSPTTASLGILVTNRVREVRRIVTQLNNDSITIIFRYVNTSQNPADTGTRGLSREQMHDRYWWEGPEFLKKPMKEWKHSVYQLWEDVIGDDSGAFTNVNFTCGQDDTPNALMDLCRYSSFSMAKRVTTWTLRFIKKTMRRLKEDTKDRIVAHIPEIKDVSDVPCNINGSEVRAGRYTLIRNLQLLFLTKEYRKIWKTPYDPT